MTLDMDRVQVEILGETFTVKGETDGEDIRRTGDFLQEQLETLQARYPTLSDKRLAILAAFRLADELLQVRRNYETLVSILDNP